jgi:hypothetical protein
VSSHPKQLNYYQCTWRGGSITDERVELTIATRPQNDFPHGQILHTKSLSVRLNRAIIIIGEFAHIDDIFNNGGRVEDMVQVEGMRGESGVTDRVDWNYIPVPNYDVILINGCRE